MRNLKLTIEYNGSCFFGWQKQEGKRTVQGKLEEAFFKLLGQKVDVEGSGRTDRGVHALGQVASVQIESNIPLKNIKRALNNLLAEDVLVKKVELAQADFHARFSAKKKTYEYVVQTKNPSAINFSTTTFYGYDVDLQKMKQAAQFLVGKHDFHAFCSSDTTVKSFVRQIFSLKISKRGGKITFEVCGDGFLYNMVRIIVGTLLEVGRGKIPLSQVQKALESGDRSLAGTTMKPNGLFLKKVEYV